MSVATSSDTKKPAKKPQWIDVGAIPVVLGFCDSIESYEAQMKRMKQDPTYPFSGTNACASCHTIYDNGNTEGPKTSVLICFPDWERHNYACFAALCAHEASHAADSCFAAMREDKPGEEVRAHLIQYITQQLITYLKS